ncbi:MAG TPA: ABC transporter permease [Candidatus Saccharimonadales bacterium]
MKVIYFLWLRQLKRYIRSKSRIVGSVGQPLLFLLALGFGLGAAFKHAGQGNYLEFLVPGIMVQTVLFSAMFFGAMIIFDRQFGFLKETMVAPVSRFKIMIGGALGGATTATIQGTLVLLISFALGFRVYNYALIPVAIGIMAIMAIAIACFSSAFGSFVQDMQGFQAINQFLVFPLYFLSGALYPLNNVPTWLKYISEINPISYGVDAMRWVLIGHSTFGIYRDMLVLLVTLAVCAIYGTRRFNRIEA